MLMLFSGIFFSNPVQALEYAEFDPMCETGDALVHLSLFG